MGEDDGTPPEATPERSYDAVRSSRAGIGLGKPRATESLLRIAKKTREESRQWLPIYDEYADQRPKTRGDCVDAARPCPWLSCKFHTYLDVKKTADGKDRSITFNFPDIEPEDIQPERSCVLDIADQGGATLEDVAKLMNVTRERVRQVQNMALANVEDALEDAGVIEIDDERPAAFLQRSGEKSLLSNRKKTPDLVEEEVVEVIDDDLLSLIDGDSLSFFSDSPHADHLVSERVWRIYQRESIEGGHVQRPKSDRQKKLEAEGAEPLVDLPLPEAMTPRHNEVMATSKKIRNVGNLNERERKVFDTYTMLRSVFNRVPNNKEIARDAFLTVSQVGTTRSALVKRRLMKPSPRGKTPDMVSTEGIDGQVEKMVKKNKASFKSDPARKAKVKKAQRISKPQEFGIRVSDPKGGPKKVEVHMEHQQLPDDAMQSAAEVLALPRGPLADAANAIRNEIITLDGQRKKLEAALHALGALA